MTEKQGLRIRLCVYTLTAFSAIVFAVRVRSILINGNYALFETEGTESMGLYAIWKVIHSFPLYESPLRGNFALTLYNFLFYQVYGKALAVIAAVGVHGAAAELMPLFGKLLTALFATLGASSQYRILAGIRPMD